MNRSEIEEKIFTSNLWRYGLSLGLFAVVIAVAILLTSFGIKINLTILVLVALVIAAWYGGRGPGILLVVLVEATAVAFNPVPPDSTLLSRAFGHFSVLVLLVFVALLISGRKGVETRLREQREQLRELNENLEQRVRERTIELEAANGELEAFSYSVSHDLRAPLRAIDGFSAALMEDYPDKLDAEGQGYLKHVREASQNMAQLIDDLLKLSNVTRAEIFKENIDLSLMAHEIVDELSRREPGRLVDIDIKDNLLAYADARLLRIALQNLLDNAWKFTSKQPAAHIAVGANPGEDGREFYVRDNGAGFDMKYADKLFGAFQRLHSSSDFDGTGIGLATVQRVVRRHGGAIRAESAVGEGTGFYFTL